MKEHENRVRVIVKKNGLEKQRKEKGENDGYMVVFKKGYTQFFFFFFVLTIIKYVVGDVFVY